MVLILSQNETDVSKDIVKHLVAMGWVVIRVNSGNIAKKSYVYAYEIKNKTIMVKVKTAIGKAVMHVVKYLNPKWKNSGFSDLLIMKNGKVIFLEIKTPSGKQSDKQKEFQEIVESVGVPYVLADCINDVKELD